MRYGQALSEEGCEARKRFLRLHERHKRQEWPIVYLDETGFEQEVHRTHGWAAKGCKVHGCQDAHQRPRTNLIGGYVDHKLIAPMLFTGACNTAVFNEWLEHMLLPQLQVGSVIVMDNAAFHKSQRTLELIAQAGCEVLFLPPYSPDLNPIEHVWANLKRQRQHLLCSVEELLQTSHYL